MEYSTGKKSQAKKYEKINRGKDERVHILSNLIKCPYCGAGLYGNKSRKRNKNKEGEHYKDYYYYGCKHRQMMNGHKCTFNKDELQIILRHLNQTKFVHKQIKWSLIF